MRLSTENNDFQHADVLRRNRQKRQAYGEIFVEGVQPLNLALKNGWPVSAFLYAPERELSDWARNILEQSTANFHFELPVDLLKKLSGKDEGSELFAIVEMPPDDLARIALGSDPLVLVFDRPGNPGNLGTLIRSADALGADGLVITGHGVDLYDPETISASRGSLFALPVVRVAGPRDLLPWIASIRREVGSLTVVATDEDAPDTLWSHDFCPPHLVLLGNERWGLSAAYRELADARVRIPMEGAASSLNVAVAGSIVLYEVSRQRQSEGLGFPRR